MKSLHSCLLSDNMWYRLVAKIAFLGVLSGHVQHHLTNLMAALDPLKISVSVTYPAMLPIVPGPIVFAGEVTASFFCAASAFWFQTNHHPIDFYIVCLEPTIGLWCFTSQRILLPFKCCCGVQMTNSVILLSLLNNSYYYLYWAIWKNRGILKFPSEYWTQYKEEINKQTNKLARFACIFEKLY